MTRLSTAVDLSAFAPAWCGHSPVNSGRGHDLRVRRGSRMVSYAPCNCQGVRDDEQKRLGHIQVKCTRCEREGRRVVFYDPPHVEESSGGEPHQGAWVCTYCGIKRRSKPCPHCGCCKGCCEVYA